MVLDAFLLDPLHYKLWFKDKRSVLEKGVATSPTHRWKKGAFRLSSTPVCQLTNLYIWGSLNKFPDFYCMGTFINSAPLRSNLLRLQCTLCTVPTTSGTPHGCPLVWACQWPSSQPLSSPQLSHNDNFWA